MTAATATAMPVADAPTGRAVEQRVLRILSGRLAGKAFPLDGRQRLCIGHGLANDVVLRGTGTRDCTVELQLSGTNATLGVIAGRVELLGRMLEAGEQAILPHYLPFRLGEYLVAHGARLSPRWDDAEALADAPPGTPVGQLRPPSLHGRALSLAHRWAGGIDRRMVRIGMALGCVALVAFAATEPLGRLIAGGTADKGALQHDLQQAGFSAVSVKAAPGGGLSVTGVVRDEAELGRLRALAADRAPDTLVDAETSQSLAAGATDILQQQGVAARVASPTPGLLAVSAGYMPADRQDALRSLLRHDLPAIRQVAFRIDDALSASPLQAFFTRSGAGLATVVGNPAHIVTADGSRWFPGATLPTGHRLVTVSPTSVTFEKDGRAEQITL